VKADLPDGFEANLAPALQRVEREIKEVDRLLTLNRIWVDRTKGVGILTRENALSYSITGPVGRASGLNYDVRKTFPYFVYDRIDFDVPLGDSGDNYDRYLVRMEEMRQSMRIIRQAMRDMPGGPINIDAEGKFMESVTVVDEAKMGRTRGLMNIVSSVDPTLDGTERPFRQRVMPDDKRVVLPSKENTYANIEGLMNHFKLIMDYHGIRPPRGDAYFASEGANGELGFYAVSDGGDRPYRVRVRPPCFFNMAGLHTMLEGFMMADIIATFGSINMIAGELDR